MRNKAGQTRSCLVVLCLTLEHMPGHAGGGHYNHTMFWKVMGKPGDNNGPSSDLKSAISTQLSDKTSCLRLLPCSRVPTNAAGDLPVSLLMLPYPRPINFSLHRARYLHQVCADVVIPAEPLQASPSARWTI